MHPHRKTPHICSICKQHVTYIPQYNRWWCDTCRKYSDFDHSKKSAQPSSEKDKSGKPGNKKSNVCPSCKGHLTFVAQYNQWWCTSCRRYVVPGQPGPYAWPPQRKPDSNIDSELDTILSLATPARRSRHKSHYFSRSKGGRFSSDKETQKRLYSSPQHGGSIGLSQYRIRDDRVFASGSNRNEPQGVPLYRIRGDRLYKTSHHPDGPGGAASFRIRGDRLYPTHSHRRKNKSKSRLLDD